VISFAQVSSGYNTIIIEEIKNVGADEYDKIYYGPSLSAGVQVRGRRKGKFFLNIELIAPFRSGKYKDDIAALRKNHGVILYFPPITFSFEYHFGF